MRKGLCVVALLSQLVWGQVVPFLDQGNQKMAAQNFVGALADYKAGLKIHPAHPDLLYGAGTAALRAGQPAQAVQFLKELQSVSPEHVDGLERLIQAQQSLGRDREVTKLSDELRALLKRKPVARFTKEPFFLRQVFDYEGFRFYVFEHLAPNTQKRDHHWDIVYRRPGASQDEGMFYLMLDEAASEVGGREMWFLDYRNPQGRRPITAFDYQPTLAEVTELVKTAVDGKKPTRFKMKDGTKL